MSEIQTSKPRVCNSGVRLTKDVYNIIKAKAIQDETTVSDVLRAIVEAWVRDQQK
jgi:hypothetical protein